MTFFSEILILTLVVVLGTLGAFLLFSTFNMYSPKPVLNLSPIDVPATLKENVPEKISILTWNIGYAGLDKSEDFFMDGGTMSMPKNKNVVDQNMKAVTDFLSSNKTDFVLLQEVDKKAARSYGINEVDRITKTLKNYEAFYAINYKVDFVPVPINHPMGKVESGIMVLTKYRSIDAIRYAFPGDYSWPTNLFQLKRCFIVTRYKIKNSNKELILVNLHLSAFDKSGNLRKGQLNFLRNFMLKAYQNGNYVLVGGDWNNIMPGISIDRFPHTTPKKYIEGIYMNLPKNWTPVGWKWAFDPKIPSVRSDEKPYVKGENFTTVIDGFLLSPNLKLVSVKTFDLGFSNSDHNPVELIVEITK